MSEEKIVENKPEEKIKAIIKPTRGGLMKRTLKELEKLQIHLKDVFSMENITINLSWEKVIRLVNYNAGKKVLHWDHTFEETMEILQIFLL